MMYVDMYVSLFTVHMYNNPVNNVTNSRRQMIPVLTDIIRQVSTRIIEIFPNCHIALFYLKLDQFDFYSSESEITTILHNV